MKAATNRIFGKKSRIGSPLAGTGTDDKVTGSEATAPVPAPTPAPPVESDDEDLFGGDDDEEEVAKETIKPKPVAVEASKEGSETPAPVIISPTSTTTGTPEAPSAAAGGAVTIPRKNQHADAAAGTAVQDQATDLGAKYGLQPGVKIPKSVEDRKLLHGKTLEALKKIPVDLANESLTEYDDAVQIKGASIRNHGAYLLGVIKRYVDVQETRGASLMQPALTPSVHKKLDHLVRSGYFTQSEMDEKVKGKIRMLSERDALTALDELSSVDRSQIRNMGSYLMGIIVKRHKNSQSSGNSGNGSGSNGDYGRDSRSNNSDRPPRRDNDDRYYRESNRKDSYGRRERERSRDRFDDDRRRDDRGRHDHYGRGGRDRDASHYGPSQTNHGPYGHQPPPPMGGNMPGQHPPPQQMQPPMNSYSQQQPPYMQQPPPGGNNQFVPPMHPPVNQNYQNQGYPPPQNQNFPPQNQGYPPHNRPGQPPNMMGQSPYNQQQQPPQQMQPPMNSFSQQQQHPSYMQQPNGPPPPPPQRASRWQQAPAPPPGANNGWQQPQQQPGLGGGSFDSQRPSRWQQAQPPQQQPAQVPLDILGLADKAASAVQQLTGQANLAVGGPNPPYSAPPRPPYQNVPPPGSNPMHPVSNVPYTNGTGPVPHSSMPYNPMNANSAPHQNENNRFNGHQQPGGHQQPAGGPPNRNNPRRGRATTTATLSELPIMVQYAVQNLQATRQVDNALDGGILGMIKDLPEPLALAALQKFSSCDKNTMRNKTAYLAGVLRRELERINRR